MQPREDSTLSPETLAVTLGRPARRPGAAVSPPLELSSTFIGVDEIPAASAAPIYGRPDNASVRALEAVLAGLEGAEHAVVFGSGMAAIAAAAALTPPGARVVAPTVAYNTTAALLRADHDTGRLRLTTADSSDLAGFCDQVRAGEPDGSPTALVWLESPGNPLLQIVDLAVAAEAAHQVGALVVVDNTFATPLTQRPLRLGADVVVHSVTKYLAGHSDLVLGAALTDDADLAERLRTHRRVRGGIAGPFEAWLALRGVRTLAVRFDRAQQNAAELARRLAGHDTVLRVGYPGLPSFPGHDVAARQMTGFGAMLTIELVDAETADRVVSAVRVWGPATSLGGVESLLERRSRNATEPAEVPAGLIRLSVGIENVEDLWADLSQALAQA